LYEQTGVTGKTGKREELYCDATLRGGRKEHVSLGLMEICQGRGNEALRSLKKTP